MKRIAIVTTINELKEIIKEKEKELKEMFKRLNIDRKTLRDIYFLLVAKNETRDVDSWEFER